MRVKKIISNTGPIVGTWETKEEADIAAWRLLCASWDRNVVGAKYDVVDAECACDEDYRCNNPECVAEEKWYTEQFAGIMNHTPRLEGATA